MATLLGDQLNTFDLETFVGRWMKGHMNGLRVRYSSATAIVVETGQARDSSDGYNLTLAAESTVSITTIAAALGLDETTLSETATTHGTATFEPNTSIWLATALSSTVRNLTGAISTVGTALTGTNLLTELRVGDVVRSASKGGSRVTAIASDTAATLVAALPGGDCTGEGGSVYENLVIRIAAETPRRVNTISHAGTSVVCSSAWTSNTSGVAIKVGGEMASCVYCPWLVYGGSGTTVILSTQRTRPYGVTGYTTAWRRLPAIENNSSSDIARFRKTFLGGSRWRHQRGGTQFLAAGVQTSYTRVSTDGHCAPTANTILLLGTISRAAAATNDTTATGDVSPDGNIGTATFRTGNNDNAEHGATAISYAPMDFDGSGIHYKVDDGTNDALSLSCVGWEETC